MLQEKQSYGGRATFYYSTDGKKIVQLGESFQPKVGRWVGAKVGLFATGMEKVNDSSNADFDWFRVEENR